MHQGSFEAFCENSLRGIFLGYNTGDIRGAWTHITLPPSLRGGKGVWRPERSSGVRGNDRGYTGNDQGGVNKLQVSTSC